jgi:hypothetical protein
MTNEVATLPKLPQRQPTEVQQGPATNNIPNAVGEIMAGLQTALAGMSADDVTVELSAYTEGDRSSAHFKIRAYKRNKEVVSREG